MSSRSRVFDRVRTAGLVLILAGLPLAACGDHAASADQASSELKGGIPANGKDSNKGKGKGKDKDRDAQADEDQGEDRDADIDDGSDESDDRDATVDEAGEGAGYGHVTCAADGGVAVDPSTGEQARGKCKQKPKQAKTQKGKSHGKGEQD